MINPANNLLNPIEFLGLQALNPTQKQHLLKPILADISAFFIARLLTTLSEPQQQEFVDKLKQVSTRPVATLDLLHATFPDLDTQKTALLEEYRHHFRLQKFIDYL